MVLRYLFGSWSPNKYHKLGDLSLRRLLKLVGFAAFASVLLFLLLSLPAVFHADEAVDALRQTTSVSLNGSLSQTTPTYLLRNPDVLVTTGEEEAFLRINRDGVTLKRFVYFGETTYSWSRLSSLEAFPATNIVVRLLLFLLPSLLFWGTTSLLLVTALLALLYSSTGIVVLHSKGFSVTFKELLKISLYASLPSMMLFAAIPVLRLGLPIEIVIGFLFVLWLILSLLGTALFTDRHLDKPAATHRSKPRKT
jgi:hypothetical protein